MAKVILVVATVAAALPAGITAGAFRFAIDGQSQDAPGTEASFDNVEPGDHTASVQRLDLTGAALGDAVTQAFTVPPVAVSTFDAPASLTITFA